MNTKDVEEIVKEMTKHTMWQDNSAKLLERRLREIITTITQDHEAEVERAVATERQKHAHEVNRILNMHSKPIAEGGLDYVKAFEEMERYERLLFTPTKTDKQ